MYDISDDDLPQDVKHGLQAKGWRFDANAQEWRKYNDAEQHFSPVPGDHQRIWAADLAAVISDIAAGEVKEPFPGADTQSSKQVQGNDGAVADEQAAARALFEADAVKTGYAKPWVEAPEGMKAHFIRLATTQA